MKIYFVASIKGRPKLFNNYKAIVDTLRSLGHEVEEYTLYEKNEYVYGLSEKEMQVFHAKINKSISNADFVVTEVSYPSVNVGHEITLSLDKGKPVIILYTKGNIPNLLRGITSEKLFLLEYDMENIKQNLKSAIEIIREVMDVRFTILLPPKIIGFLNDVSKEKNIPRSVYIRGLIEEKMEEAN